MEPRDTSPNRLGMAGHPRRRGRTIETPPAGTVTFAFTDIEGSTARWERDRIAMQHAVRRHDAILRTAIAEYRGHVFKTIGDAFCSAFARPQDAVAAMFAAQNMLAAEDFSAVDGLRVRAAINTGAADEREDDYFGPVVNKVSRLLAIGHGGQVLLTAETAALVGGALPLDASLRELGAYHLKDFTEPQRVYQLLAPGLPADFPPLRSLGTLTSDLSIVDMAEFHPVPSFSGRDEELATVHAALKHDGAIAVVHGLGGVGKSSIAREYGWHNRDGYSIIWWLNAQTEDGIIDGLLRLGAMFVQGLDQLANRRAAAQRVINSVLGGFDKPVLLVFDNLEDEGLMRTWLPRTARALATSRDAAWSTDIAAIPLQIWSFETATEYLQRASGRADLSDAAARAIAQILGALPLALAHAAAALRNLRMVSAQRYLEHINEHLRSAPRGAEYPRSVFATFSTAIVQAEHEAAGAAAILSFAACFAPDAIPDELFRQPSDNYPANLRPQLSEGDALDLHSVVVDELRLDEALGALDRLSLLTFSQGSATYSMHRLVQLAAQDLASDAAHPWPESAVGVANAAFPPDGFAAWRQCERLLPHVRAALDALSDETAFSPAADVAYRCGIYLWRRGDYRTAEALLVRALTIRERVLGPNHLDVAVGLTGLAIVLDEQGRHGDSIPLFTRALAIREKALGADHPSVAKSLSNLAFAYENMDQQEQAEALYARALACHEKALGPDHDDVATCLNNLGSAYSNQGRYGEALPLHVRALAIREKVLGSNHPDIAVSLSNLAEAYSGQGRYDEAESLFARALAIREEALGPDHPDVAKALVYSANLFEARGRDSEAEPLYARALAIRERALGPDHPKAKAVREKLEGLRSR
jgi:class 3 adenylate cyclase/tetratricopeptide (TPR) repeat protein